MPENIEIEARIAQQEMDSDELIRSVEKLGKISRLTCPDCHGALWEMNDAENLRFRCHVGHAFSAESLSNGQGEMLETALWSAVRALEEQDAIWQNGIVERARAANFSRAVHTFERLLSELRRIVLRYGNCC